MIAIIGMHITVALAFIFAKLALQYGAPFFVVSVRTLFAGSCFLLFQRIYDKKNFFLRREDIFLFLNASLFYVYLVFLPEFWALEKVSASKTTLIYTLTPFIVALFAYFLVNERFSFRKILGMLIGLAGMFCIFITKEAGNQSAEFLYISTREAALFISVVAYGYAWFLIKRLTNKGYSLAMINGVTLLIGGIGSTITSFLYEGFFPVQDTSRFLLWTILFTVLSNGVFYVTYGWLLRHYSFTLLSFAGFLTPVFGILFGWLILHESITAYHFLSLAFIFTGLAIFYASEIKQQK